MASTELRAAAQQALEALGLWANGRDMDAVALNDLIFRLDALLAEPVPPIGKASTDVPLPVFILKKAEPCPCGDRPAAQCPGEWEPGCDLGNNPEYARRRVNLAEPGRAQRMRDAGYTRRPTLREMAEPQEPDLSRCPKCGGPADNGHDREVPPTPYFCTKCMAEPVQEPVAWLWQHRETGRTRVLMPDERTATDVAAAWDVVGPLYLAPPQRPAEPVGVVTSMVKGGVTWRRWPADMPDGTLLFSEVQP